jgi:hypothetical protein
MRVSTSPNPTALHGMLQGQFYILPFRCYRRLRWLDDIKMDLGEVGWIGLAQDRDKWRALVNAVVNLRVP